MRFIVDAQLPPAHSKFLNSKFEPLFPSLEKALTAGEKLIEMV